jgi:hypothetical protein
VIAINTKSRIPHTVFVHQHDFTQAVVCLLRLADQHVLEHCCDRPGGCFGSHQNRSLLEHFHLAHFADRGEHAVPHNLHVGPRDTLTVHEHNLRKQKVSFPRRAMHTSNINKKKNESAIDSATFIQAHQERQLLKPYSDVLQEAEQLSAEQLQSFMLYRAAHDPLCIQDYLLMPRGDHLEGMFRFVHDQLHPIVEEELFMRLARYISDDSHPLHRAFLFWTFVALMLVEESVLRVVRDTWKGSERMWSVVLLPYLNNRFDDLLLSPMDPENGDMCIEPLRQLVRVELCMFNVPCMLLEGILRPVAVPLSRNALRDRKRDVIAQRAADNQAKQMAAHQLQQQQPSLVEEIFAKE